MTQKRKKSVFWAGGFGAALFLVALGLLIGYEAAYAQKVYKGIEIGEHDASGMTSAELVALLDAYQAELMEDGVEFEFEDQVFVLSPAVYGGEADIAYSELFTIDVNKTAEAVYGIGRSGNFLDKARDQLAALIGRRTPSADVYLLEDDIMESLHSEFGEYETQAKNAQLFVEPDDSFRVEPHANGETIQHATVIGDLHYALAKLREPAVSVALETEQARVHTEDVATLLTQAEHMAQAAPIALAFEEQSWEVDRSTLARWIWVEAEALESSDAHVLSATTQLALNEQRVEEFLNTFAGDIEREAKNGKFEIRDGKVVEFQVAQTGIEIDVETTAEQIHETIQGEDDERAPITIAYTEVEPEVTADEIGDMGVSQLLGTGHTNFRGSGPNRIHNVNLGASRLHGTLVAPGEEFSTLEIMNGFIPEDGWKEGYVIKGDRTVPEYGGGACQFGTTLFRATLASGLPVTNRAPHSYIVSYYYDENGDPGKDATIYDPGRDYQFINDTENYVLIQSRIDGYDFYIDFWGTDDGRVAEQTSVRTWNWTPAPETQYIETDELEPGVTDCIERARSGVNTAFDYTVTYTDGHKEEDTFSSKYKAWPQVCLVGQQPDAEQETAEE